MGVALKKIKPVRQLWATKKRSARPAVFLDRDGVLIRQRDHVRDRSHMRPLRTVVSAIKRMRDMGYLIVIISNQPDIGRGNISVRAVETLMRDFRAELARHGALIDASYLCSHEFKDDCDCRKPKQALIKAAQRDLHIDLKNSWFVGDTTRDMETARVARMRSILVSTGNGGRDTRFFKTRGDLKAASLAGAARRISDTMRSRI